MTVGQHISFKDYVGRYLQLKRQTAQKVIVAGAETDRFHPCTVLHLLRDGADRRWCGRYCSWPQSGGLGVGEDGWGEVVMGHVAVPLHPHPPAPSP